MSTFHILHTMHINPKYAEQNRALLDTLRIHQSNNNRGHIALYSTLPIGHAKHKGHMRVSSWPFVPRKLQQTNRQDMVFIRPPGISDGAFQLIYERREQAQVLYVISVSSIPLVPVGVTGTIPFAMRRESESADFPGAFCDKSANSGDGCRWWYVNIRALGWGTKQ